MSSGFFRRPSGRLGPVAALSLAALAALPAAAQYKVIGADGKVTYTDRAPATTEGRLVPIGPKAAAPAPEPELPFELRQVASRYPVTLYVSSGACEPCEAGRTLLRQRGIPYAEKQVLSAEDGEALEKLSGSRDVPTLTIGSQIVRGMTAELWTSYLDAAGYPRESKLPPSYQQRAATPVVERREAAAAPRPAARPAPETPQIDRTPASSGGIRF